MASIRDGKQSALLVVDAQVGVLRELWESPRIVENIQVALAKARNAGVPVIWVQHCDDELVQDSPAWQLPPELLPVEGEGRIYKRYNSSFQQTELEALLARLGVGHLVLAGAASNWCIRATAYAALERGYDLTLVKDGHTTANIEFEDGTLIRAEDIILDLNVAMRWLSYPECRNTVLTAQELSFA